MALYRADKSAVAPACLAGPQWPGPWRLATRSGDQCRIKINSVVFRRLISVRITQHATSTVASCRLSSSHRPARFQNRRETRRSSIKGGVHGWMARRKRENGTSGRLKSYLSIGFAETGSMLGRCSHAAGPANFISSPGVQLQHNAVRFNPLTTAHCPEIRSQTAAVGTVHYKWPSPIRTTAPRHFTLFFWRNAGGLRLWL